MLLRETLMVNHFIDPVLRRIVSIRSELFATIPGPDRALDEFEERKLRAMGSHMSP